MGNLKRRVFDLIESPTSESGASRAFNIGMLILIFLNVLAVIFETEEVLYSKYQATFLCL